MSDFNDIRIRLLYHKKLQETQSSSPIPPSYGKKKYVTL